MDTPKSSLPSGYQSRRHSIDFSNKICLSPICRNNNNNAKPTPIAFSSPMSTYQTVSADNRHDRHNQTVHEEGTIRSSVYGGFSSTVEENDEFRPKFNAC